MKWMKTMIAMGMAMSMTFGMSAVSYAQFPLNMMIGSTAPISMQECAYEPSLENATVKHSEQTVKILSLPQQEMVGQMEEKFFYPGDTLYIPLVDSLTNKVYAEKTRPENWSFQVNGFNSQAVSNVRWSNENGSLSIAVDFSKNLPQSENITFFGTITLYDTQQKNSSRQMTLNATLGNITRELVPTVVNEVVSPMNLYAGKNYHGEPINLSFGGNVYFQGAVLQEGQTIYLNLDNSFDNNIANQYKSFDIQCYNFLGDEDAFEQPGKVCLPAQKTDSYVYEVTDGTLKRIQSNFDEENGLVCFVTNSLGYYIVSPILMT